MSALVIALSTALNPWLLTLLLTVLPMDVLVRRPRLRRRRPRQRGSPDEYHVAQFVAVLLGVIFVMYLGVFASRDFSFHAPGGFEQLLIPSTYRSSISFSSRENVWTHHQELVVEVPERHELPIELLFPLQLKRDVAAALERQEWVYEGRQNGNPVFSREDTGEFSASWWRLRWVHEVEIGLPTLTNIAVTTRRINVDGILQPGPTSEVVITSPTHLVLRTAPNSATASLLNGRERRAFPVGETETVRIELLAPILRNPLGFRVATVTTSGWAWPIMLFLLLAIFGEIRRQLIEDVFDPLVGRILEPIRDRHSKHKAK